MESLVRTLTVDMVPVLHKHALKIVFVQDGQYEVGLIQLLPNAVEPAAALHSKRYDDSITIEHPSGVNAIVMAPTKQLAMAGAPIEASGARDWKRQVWASLMFPLRM